MVGSSVYLEIKETKKAASSSSTVLVRNLFNCENPSEKKYTRLTSGLKGAAATSPLFGIMPMISKYVDDKNFLWLLLGYSAAIVCAGFLMQKYIVVPNKKAEELALKRAFMLNTFALLEFSKHCQDHRLDTTYFDDNGHEQNIMYRAIELANGSLFGNGLNAESFLCSSRRSILDTPPENLNEIALELTSVSDAVMKAYRSGASVEDLRKLSIKEAARVGNFAQLTRLLAFENSVLPNLHNHECFKDGFGDNSVKLAKGKAITWTNHAMIPETTWEKMVSVGTFAAGTFNPLWCVTALTAYLFDYAQVTGIGDISKVLDEKGIAGVALLFGVPLVLMGAATISMRYNTQIMMERRGFAEMLNYGSSRLEKLSMQVINATRPNADDVNDVNPTVDSRMRRVVKTIENNQRTEAPKQKSCCTRAYNWIRSWCGSRPAQDDYVNMNIDRDRAISMQPVSRW